MTHEEADHAPHIEEQLKVKLPQPDMMKDVMCQFANRVQLEILPGAVRLCFGQQVGPTAVIPVGGIVLTMADFQALLLQGNQVTTMMRTRPVVGGDRGILVPSQG